MLTSQNPDYTVIIEANSPRRLINLGEIWTFRELIYYMTWRDVKVRYKQTILGAGWAIMRPVLTMLVFTFVFGQVMQVDTGDIPYPIFNYVALLPWTLFSTAIANASNSLVANANMIKKIYFPRVVMPISGMLSSVVDFLPAFAVLIVLMLIYRIPVTLNILAVIPLTILTVITSAGTGLLLAGLNVIFRDIRYATPFLIQILMWLSPVGYPVSQVPSQWQLLYSLNPLVGVIEGFRWALLGTTDFNLTMLGISLIGSVLLFIVGLVYFQRMEKTFADVI